MAPSGVAAKSLLYWVFFFLASLLVSGLEDGLQTCTRLQSLLGPSVSKLRLTLVTPWHHVCLFVEKLKGEKGFTMKEMAVPSTVLRMRKEKGSTNRG